MPDPIQKCFGYGQLWPLRPAYRQSWARLFTPDPTFCMQFGSVLPKKAQIILYKTGLVRFWPNAPGLKVSLCARITGSSPATTQPARYQFPTLRCTFVLLLMAQIILCRTSLDLIWFQLTVSGLGHTDKSRSKPACDNHCLRVSYVYVCVGVASIIAKSSALHFM